MTTTRIFFFVPKGLSRTSYVGFWPFSMVLDTISPADLSIDDGVMAGNEVTIAEARYTLNGTYVLELGKKRAIRFSMLID